MRLSDLIFFKKNNIEINELNKRIFNHANIKKIKKCNKYDLGNIFEIVKKVDFESIEKFSLYLSAMNEGVSCSFESGKITPITIELMKKGYSQSVSNCLEEIEYRDKITKLLPVDIINKNFEKLRDLKNTKLFEKIFNDKDISPEECKFIFLNLPKKFFDKRIIAKADVKSIINNIDMMDLLCEIKCDVIDEELISLLKKDKREIKKTLHNLLKIEKLNQFNLNIKEKVLKEIINNQEYQDDITNIIELLNNNQVMTDLPMMRWVCAYKEDYKFRKIFFDFISNDSKRNFIVSDVFPIDTITLNNNDSAELVEACQKKDYDKIFELYCSGKINDILDTIVNKTVIQNFKEKVMSTEDLRSKYQNEKVIHNNKEVEIITIDDFPFMLAISTLGKKEKNSGVATEDVASLIVEHPEMWMDMNVKGNNRISFNRVKEDQMVVFGDKDNSVIVGFNGYNIADKILHSYNADVATNMDINTISVVKRDNEDKINLIKELDKFYTRGFKEKTSNLVYKCNMHDYEEMRAARYMYDELGGVSKYPPDYVVWTGKEPISEATYNWASFYGIPIIKMDKEAINKKALVELESVVNNDKIESLEYCNNVAYLTRIMNIDISIPIEEVPPIDLDVRIKFDGLLEIYSDEIIKRANNGDVVALDAISMIEKYYPSLQKKFDDLGIKNHNMIENNIEENKMIN